MESSGVLSSESPSSSSNGCCRGCVQRYRDTPVFQHTSIPLREEFRFRRFLFSYHDLRAFTTSVLPQPIFVLYRVVIFLYLLLWILYDGIEEMEGAGYLVFFTIWGYILLLAGLLSTTVAAIVYMIVSYCKPEWIEKRLPQYSPLQPSGSFYQQDGTPWYLKICWFLYTLGVTPSLPIVFVYWVFEGSDAVLTPENVHIHGINFLFAVVDVLVSRIPIQLFHFYTIMLFGVAYTIFQAVFFAAGGTNPNDGGHYVYKFVDFGANPTLAVGICFALVFIGAIVHGLFFGIAQLRDVIAKCIPGCSWNVPSMHSSDLHDQPIDMLRETWLVKPTLVSGRDKGDDETDSDFPSHPQ